MSGAITPLSILSFFFLIYHKVGWNAAAWSEFEDFFLIKKQPPTLLSNLNALIKKLEAKEYQIIII